MPQGHSKHQVPRNKNIPIISVVQECKQHHHDLRNKLEQYEVPTMAQ